MTLCEEDCTIIEYDYENEKEKCQCLMKIKLPLIENIKFDKKELYKNFVDIKNIVNYKLLNCFKNFFNKNSLKKNYGFFIYLLSSFRPKHSRKKNQKNIIKIKQQKNSSKSKSSLIKNNNNGDNNNFQCLNNNNNQNKEN